MKNKSSHFGSDPAYIFWLNWINICACWALKYAFSFVKPGISNNSEMYAWKYDCRFYYNTAIILLFLTVVFSFDSARSLKICMLGLGLMFDIATAYNMSLMSTLENLENINQNIYVYIYKSKIL